MAQPSVTKDIFFGNKALPNGQGVLGWVNLNDGTNWSIETVGLDGSNRQLATAQRALQAGGIYLSDDYAPRKIQLSAKYYETTAPLGAVKAQLQQAGEQYLTFDNKVTAILAKCAGFGTPKMLRRFAPMEWQVPVDFLCAVPWFVDQAITTTPNALAVAGSTGVGTATSFSIAYAGSIYAAPIFVLTVPSSNTQAITSVKIQNTMSGETLTWTGSISASVAHTLTVDSGLFTVLLDTTPQDATGAFSRLYGPPTQSNTFIITIVAAGATTGLTLTGTHYPRWDM